MKICTVCKRKFPDHLIQPFISNVGAYARICPICALKNKIKIHGLPKDTQFHGEMAKSLWEEAVKYLKGEQNAKRKDN